MRAPVARAAADLRLLRAAVFTAVCVTLSAAGHVLAAGQGLPLWTVGAGCAAVLAVAVPLAGRERSLPGIAALLAAGQLALHFLFSCGQDGPAARSAPGAGAGDRHGLLELAGRLLCDDRATAALSEAEARRVVGEAGLSLSALPGAAHPGHPGGPGHAGHAVPAGTLAAETPAECLQAAVRTALSLLSVPMLLGHLLAALVMGWLLRRGDDALWRLVRLYARQAAVGDALAGALLVRALRTALRWARALSRGLLPAGLLPPSAPRTDRGADPVPPRSLPPGHPVVRRGPPCSADDLTLAV
ncbi:hypothetical protein CUT44_18620 [Streptomyces carminius]|uniref:Integral membrane protein n=1 Tax=Streptomyces carminius TaxID=2665496 RepID=A0A2M8LX48_9ACTN|nr:hypothetical protein [Streptomyces carminius]PJE96504.1 hypothetical protein CUT44_18620 [Streptomyces carminius]